MSQDSLAELFERIPTEILDRFLEVAPKEIERRSAVRRLDQYRPYARQLEFHAAGGRFRERILIAANQVGKTVAAGFEVAMHACGIYPSWWLGRRFDRPTRWIVGSESAELLRKGAQRILLGPPEDENQWGTGAIPQANLIAAPRRQGVPNAVASISVKHVSGGSSVLQMASYDQGRTKWQADTVDGVWFDEEPNLDLYTEGLTRSNAVLGPILITFTPMLGMSAVVKRFLIDKAPDTHVTTMALEDADHFTPEQREKIRASYPAFERDARTRGIPMRGSGSVFPLDIGEILCASFPIPDHWAQICGIDFGWSHPSAGVRLAFDRDSDVLYVIGAYRAKEQTPIMFAGAVKPWGDWLPWSWPHDGHQSGGKFGANDQQQLAAIYRSHGLKMLPSHATFENGSNGVEAGITEMLERMQTGRLKVFSEFREWQEEFTLYHRKDGVIVKEHDDLLSATRYAVMMRRFAQTKQETKPKRYQNDPIGYVDRRRYDGYDWMAQ
jgi:phage terminase large subunit-like protein